MVSDIVQSIADTIGDYRPGEIAPITRGHVERWVYQFDQKDQMVILEEIDRMMKQFYWSKTKTIRMITGLCQSTKVFGEDPSHAIRQVSFLRIQTKGASQSALLDLMDAILWDRYEFHISDCHSTDTFFYIDDCVFTGNKLRYDLVPWIETAPENSKLIIYHLCHHSQGAAYAMDYIGRAARSRNIRIEPWRTEILDNYRSVNAKLQFLWPREILSDPDIDAYCERVKLTRNVSLFRGDSSYREQVFSSPEARDIVEQAFLRVGAQLVMNAQNPAESMRPMGFEKLVSLGLGSIFISYRNISNNCPLALWYGDPSYPPSHPLGRWYPLLPRRTATDDGWH